MTASASSQRTQHGRDSLSFVLKFRTPSINIRQLRFKESPVVSHVQAPPNGMSAKWLYIAARGRQDRETGGFRAPIEGRRVGPTEAEP